MLGSDYLLKIIDFGHAQSITDNYMTYSGSKDYRAPEVITGESSNFSAADIYSAGIILFAFKTSEFPFIEDEESDHCNYNFYVKNKNYFWKLKSENQSRGFFRKDFIDLVNGMIHEDVNQRFSINQIKESKWYRESILDFEKLKVEMKSQMETPELFI